MRRRGDLQRRLEKQRRLACAGPELALLRPDAQVISLLSLAGRSEGLDASYGIDFSLAGVALALGKPVLSLETPELQLRELVRTTPRAWPRRWSPACASWKAASPPRSWD